MGDDARYLCGSWASCWWCSALQALGCEHTVKWLFSFHIRSTFLSADRSLLTSALTCHPHCMLSPEKNRFNLGLILLTMFEWQPFWISSRCASERIYSHFALLRASFESRVLDRTADNVWPRLHPTSLPLFEELSMNLRRLFRHLYIKQISVIVGLCGGMRSTVPSFVTVLSVVQHSGCCSPIRTAYIQAWCTEGADC